MKRLFLAVALLVTYQAASAQPFTTGDFVTGGHTTPIDPPYSAATQRHFNATGALIADLNTLPPPAYVAAVAFGPSGILYAAMNSTIVRFAPDGQRLRH